MMYCLNLLSTSKIAKTIAFSMSWCDKKAKGDQKIHAVAVLLTVETWLGLVCAAFFC